MAGLDEQARREIGQHFVFGFHGFDIGDQVRKLITEYFVGSIILMKRNIKDAEQTRSLVQQLQKLAKEAGHAQPLLIGIDQENGLVSAFSSSSAGTQFPGAMAQAAIGDSQMTHDISAACGQELKLVGINWTYSPVADVNLNPLNPVIGVRSFGSDPKLVQKYVTAASEGFISAGVASCAKHFPGHGDTHVDSHLALPVIEKTKRQLYDADLVPFQALVMAGVPSIMTAHIALPLVTSDRIPCSLSRRITTDLLRGELSYDGVVVTDCLEMEAISAVGRGACGTEEGALRAIEAGADIAMICHTYERQVGAIERVYEAVVGGRLSLEELKRSGTRIMKIKDKFAGNWTTVFRSAHDRDFPLLWKTLKKNNEQLSSAAYSRSVTVAQGGGSSLPLTPQANKELLLLTPRKESINRVVDSDDIPETVRNTATPYDRILADILGTYTRTQHIIYGADGFEHTSCNEISSIVFVTRNAHKVRWQRSALDKVMGELSVQGDTRIPVVVIASCDPYDREVVKEELSTGRVAFLCTYEFTAEAFEAAARIIFGVVDHVTDVDTAFLI